MDEKIFLDKIKAEREFLKCFLEDWQHNSGINFVIDREIDLSGNGWRAVVKATPANAGAVPIEITVDAARQQDETYTVTCLRHALSGLQYMYGGGRRFVIDADRKSPYELLTPLLV